MSQDRDYHSPQAIKYRRLGWTYIFFYLPALLPLIHSSPSLYNPPVNMLSAGIAFTHTGKQVRLPSTTYILEQSITLDQVERSGHQLLQLHKATAQKFDNISDVLNSKIPQGPGIHSLPLAHAVREFISRLSILGKAEMNKDAAYSKALTRELITKLLKTQGNSIPAYETGPSPPQKVKAPTTSSPSSTSGLNATFVKLFTSLQRQKRGLPLVRALKSISRLFTKIPVKRMFPPKAAIPVLLGATVVAETAGLAMYAHQAYGMQVMPVATPVIEEILYETHNKTDFLSTTDRLPAATTDYTLQDYYETFLDIISPSKSPKATVPSDLASVPIFPPGDFLGTSKVMADMEFKNKGDPAQFKELGRWRHNWSHLNDLHLEAFANLQLSMATMATEFTEGWTFMKAMTKQHNDLVQYYLDLIDHCDQGFSVKTSNVFLRAWSVLREDKQLRPSQVIAFNKQLHRVFPKILFLQNEYKIHYVFDSMPENELFDLYFSRTVPFHTNMGTFRLDLEPHMQLKNKHNQVAYIRPASFLSTCTINDDTYYCDPNDLAHDNTDKCITAALTDNLGLLLDHCHIFQTTTNSDVFALAPGVLYYDEIIEIDYSCGTMSIHHVYDDTGLFFINPGCTAQIDDLTFINSEGDTNYPHRTDSIPPLEFTPTHILDHPHIFHFSSFHWTLFGLSWQAILLFQGLLMVNIFFYHFLSSDYFLHFITCSRRLNNIYQRSKLKGKLMSYESRDMELRRLAQYPGPSPYSSDEDEPHPLDNTPIIRTQPRPVNSLPTRDRSMPTHLSSFRPPRQTVTFEQQPHEPTPHQSQATAPPPRQASTNQPISARDLRIAHLQRLEQLHPSSTIQTLGTNRSSRSPSPPISRTTAPRHELSQLPRNHPAHRNPVPAARGQHL